MHEVWKSEYYLIQIIEVIGNALDQEVKLDVFVAVILNNS